MLSLSNLEKNILKLLALFILCGASNFSFAQIILVNEFKKKNIIVKNIDNKKLVSTIQNVIKEIEETKITSLTFMYDDEKKRLKRQKLSSKELARIDAKEFVASSGKTSSILLEKIFDITQVKLASQIDLLKMAKIITSLK